MGLEPSREGDLSIIDEDDLGVEEPKDCYLIGLNDNFSPMDFVVGILVEVCHKSREEAEGIMMEIHTNNKAVMWSGSYDIAVTKKCQIDQLSLKMRYPFKTTVEE